MKQSIAFFVLPALLLGAASALHAQEPYPQEPAEAAPSSQFFKIGVQHYDAAMMADLATRQDAIVVVPPNFVIPDAGFAPALSGGPTVTTLGAAVPRPAPTALPTAASAAPTTNRLPPGVERIYALRSDNSLVIQTTPDAQYSPFHFSLIR